MPDIVGPGKHKPTSLRGIANKAKADKQHRFQNLYRCLNTSYLLSCWPLLNKNAASGVDKVTWEIRGHGKSGDTILKSPAHEIAGCPHLPGIDIQKFRGHNAIFHRNSGDIMLFSKNSIVSAEFCMMTPSPSRMQTYIQLVCRSIPQYNLCWMV